MEITYVLEDACTAGATIVLEMIGDGQIYTPVAPELLEKDVGYGITNGKNKQILWDVSGYSPEFNLENVNLRLVASEEDPVPLPTANFAKIDAGAFRMGDHFGEGNSDELPVHEVTVSTFYIGRNAVSYGLWKDVRDWAVLWDRGYDLVELNSGKSDTHPVSEVTWYDAVKWCNAASVRACLEPVYLTSPDGAEYRSGIIEPYIDYTKTGYRLPTEAEWEKAARGDLIGKRFPWGDRISHENASYRANGSAFSYDHSGYSSYTYHPNYVDAGDPYTVAEDAPTLGQNSYGLYNMSGNVWEWCNDWYDSSYYSSTPSEDPTGPIKKDEIRVHRGGSWINSANYCRVATRKSFTGDSRVNYYLGFRVVHR